MSSHCIRQTHRDRAEWLGPSISSSLSQPKVIQRAYIARSQHSDLLPLADMVWRRTNRCKTWVRISLSSQIPR